MLLQSIDAMKIIFLFLITGVVHCEKTESAKPGFFAKVWHWCTSSPGYWILLVSILLLASFIGFFVYMKHTRGASD